jgi:hypothetical protein
MRREAFTLLPSLARLEKVIGHPLNITEEIVSKRIAETVDRQVSDHKLTVHKASYNLVDWQRLVGNAVNRRPPFETKGEKGFRDAIIAETFLQLVEASPEQPQRCRVVLLTDDELLTKAVKARVAERNNIQIFGSVDELKGLINTLISTVPEDYVAQMQEKAQEYFVKSLDPDKGFIFDLKIQEAVRNKCSDQLAALPDGATRRSNGTWQLSHPRFVKKDGQRMFWVSRFSIQAKAYKEIPNQITSETLSGLNIATPYNIASSYNVLPATTIFGLSNPVVSANPPTIPKGFYGGGFGEAYTGSVKLIGNDTLVASGKTLVDASWSASVSVKGIFSKPKLESIDFIETVWEKVV